MRAAGLQVEWFFDHFGDATPDTEWLDAVGRKGWIAITHDARIRYKANELAAVVRHNVAMLLVVGHAPYPRLAEHFVHTLPRIEAFIDVHQPPYIAKVYRPTPQELALRSDAPGTVSLWYPPKR